MSDVTLYGFAPSTYTRTARMACIEAGVAHSLQPLEFKEASHLALHPFGRMPALRHGEVVLFETLAIAAYVDEVFGGKRLRPADALGRARMWQWISAANDYLYADVVGALAKADAPGDADLAAARAHVRVLEGALAGSAYFAGARLSLADLFVFPMLDYAVVSVGSSLLQGCPHLTRWHAALAQRSSAQETAA